LTVQQAKLRFEELARKIEALDWPFKQASQIYMQGYFDCLNLAQHGVEKERKLMQIITDELRKKGLGY
jgi:hypothetical protein